METLIERLERGPVPTKPIPPPNRIVRDPGSALFAWSVFALTALLALSALAAIVWSLTKMAS